MRFCGLCSVSLVLCLSASADDWKPVDPAELTEKAPKVEKDADAEALFWDVQVSDTADGGHRRAIYSNYLRIKIYNNRGRNRLSTINIPINSNSSISDLAARTIHPDGTIIDVKKDSIFDGTDKIGTVTRKSKSIPMPAVEAGSIIEYRYTLTQENSLGYVRLDYQRDIPVRIVRYAIKPYSALAYTSIVNSAPGNSLPGNSGGIPRLNATLGMAIQDFHCKRTPLVKGRDGFLETSVENVPAFRQEPFMPPQNEVRPWSLIYYRSDERIEPERFWADYGRNRYESYKQQMKVSKKIRATAAEIVGGANNDEDKVSLVSDFCRSTIKNLNTDAASAEERLEARKKIERTPDDTLTEHLGNRRDILMLFAALVSASGLDARMVQFPDRTKIFFSPQFANAYFLELGAVAVKLGDHWRFYDPASTFVPSNMLNWQNEGVLALVTDPKTPIFEKTPLSSAEQSAIRNTGVFRLSEDGTLEGDIKMIFTGHEGSIRKQMSERQSEGQREETFKNLMKNRISTAELSDVVIENAIDPIKPFAYRSHIRVPAYADRTGKRLFFAPAVFRQGIAALFPVKERTYPVVFQYPRVEEDSVTIEIPKGLEFESPEVPLPFMVGKMIRYNVSAVIEKGNTLVYKRKFVLGENGQLGVSVEDYPKLKQAFDGVLTNDKQTMTLKLAEKLPPAVQ